MIRTVQPAKVFLMQTRTYIQFLALTLTLIFSTSAVAQNATAQGTTDPGQISERFRETLATDDANLPSGFTTRPPTLPRVPRLVLPINFPGLKLMATLSMPIGCFRMKY